MARALTTIGVLLILLSVMLHRHQALRVTRIDTSTPSRLIYRRLQPLQCSEKEGQAQDDLVGIPHHSPSAEQHIGAAPPNAGHTAESPLSFAPSLINDNPTDASEFDAVEEAALDTTIEDAVQRIIDEALGKGKAAAEPTPVEKFQKMYRDLKQQKKGVDGTKKLDSAAMLEQLLGGEQSKDPFDERKVMMKLRGMLNQDDFKDLFLDPKIGDWL